MCTRSTVSRRFQRWFFMLPCTTAILALCGCSTDYTMVEVWNPRQLERTLFHAYHEGADVGLVCRQLPAGRAQVGITIFNDGTLPLVVPMQLKLYVDGELTYGENGELPVIIDPGGRKTILCRPVFKASVKRKVINLIDEEDTSQVVRIFKGAQVVYATMGPYRTPDVVMDLSPENQVPFRFKEQP